MKMIGRIAIATAALALAPLGAIVPGSTPEAEAGIQVDVHIGLPAPVAVIGYSYGNPYVLDHVHTRPIACAHGPLYYYPGQRVYAHYNPRYRYVRYEAPRLYRHGRHFANHRHVEGWGKAKGKHVRYDRGGHRYEGRRDDDRRHRADRDKKSRHHRRSGARIRGHRVR